MGAHPYSYFAKYRVSIDMTLNELRQQEFEAGRYHPVMSFIDFPITADSPAPGAQHASIEAAMEAAAEDGTRSILDMFQVSSVPYLEALDASEQDGMDLYCTTFLLSSDELTQLFGTDRPTHDLVNAVLVASDQNEEAGDEFWDSIDRGTGRHIIVYENDEPVEIFFAGYSFD
jgi:hypothetical protein